jgi:hypothetical protein
MRHTHRIWWISIWKRDQDHPESLEHSGPKEIQTLICGVDLIIKSDPMDIKETLSI